MTGMTTATVTRPAAPFDLARIRAQFPILAREVRGKPLVYLDTAATSQKPQAVIDAEIRFYEEECANVHRGVHFLSELATKDYEASRATVARFLHADPRDVIFVRGTTEGINLVAQTWGRQRIGAGDEILVTTMEHHSNIVPWQLLAQEKGAKVVPIPISDAGDLELDALERLMGPRVKLLAVTQVSNALGTVVPLDAVLRLAKERGVPVLVDGAQGAPHLGFDAPGSGADFYAFSGHKIYGPTGIGVLWAKREHLEAMPPWQGGGDMILSVGFDRTTFAKPPAKFEAGTPAIAQAIGLGAALEWLGGVGLAAAAAHEREVIAYAEAALREVPGVRFVGTPRERAGAISFLLADVHPHDVATIIDRHGVAVRAGHHCAQPVMKRFGVAATVRASFGVYSSREDVDALVRALHAAREVFA
jgi:cysteine desulfurase/selenocysteine lyase